MLSAHRAPGAHEDVFILSFHKLVTYDRPGELSLVVDSDRRFNNPCGSHRQSQSELYHVS